MKTTKKTRRNLRLSGPLFSEEPSVLPARSWISGYPSPPISSAPKTAQLQPGKPIVVTRQWPYERSLELYMGWCLNDLGTPRRKDEDGQPQPHYVLSWGTDDIDGSLAPLSYPAGHHGLMISVFLRYSVYTGNTSWFSRAVQLGDWNIAHSTPANCRYPYLPHSSYGANDLTDSDRFTRNAVMLDKAPCMGLAYLDLYNFTGQDKYKDAALRMAGTLTACQLPDGRWVQKVNFLSGQVAVPYTSNIIMMVKFFRRLAELTGKREYREAAARAWRWLLANPVQNMAWKAGYEDWTDEELKTGFQWWDTAWTVEELLGRRNEDASYIGLAEKQLSWIEETFGVWEPALAGVSDAERMKEPAFPLAWKGTAPNFKESTVFVPTSESNLRWGLLNALFYDATGRKDSKYLEYAVGALNTMTYHHSADGRPPTYLMTTNCRKQCYYSLCYVPVAYTLAIFALMPELCLSGENHILSFTSAPEKIVYAARRLTYCTRAAGVELIKTASAPLSVRLDGKDLPGKGQPAAAEKNGWIYNAANGSLRVRHGAGTVEVLLR